MSENKDRSSAEFHCAHLGASGVVANFTGKWAGWATFDLPTVKPTGEQIYNLFERGGLTFKPFVAPVQYFNAVTGELTEVPDKFAIYNGDTGATLAIGGSQLAQSMTVGGHYETLIAVVGELAKDNFPCRAISFDNGARAMIQCLIPGDHYILDRPHKAFFTLQNGLDGSGKVRLGHTDVCPVCSNTYRAALDDLELSAKHTMNLGDNLAKIQRAIFQVKESAEQYYIDLASLAKVKASAKAEKEFLYYLIPDQAKKEDAKRENSQPANRREKLVNAIGQSLAERSTSTPTLYDLLQGVTRFVTHGDKGVKNPEYVLDGVGTDFSNKAYTWLVKNS